MRNWRENENMKKEDIKNINSDAGSASVGTAADIGTAASESSESAAAAKKQPAAADKAQLIQTQAAARTQSASAKGTGTASAQAAENKQTAPKDKVYVIGHKSPDTDSICSAIAYAELLNMNGDADYIACRAGIVNEETKFVLRYFGVETPLYLGTVQPDIRDIDLNMIPGIDKDDSIKRAWELMAEQDARSVPVLSDGKVEGIVSITDIAKSYMDESDSHVLATAKTRFCSIAETLNGEIICGDCNGVFEKGKVTIAASSPDIMEEFIEESDIVIAGNRFETHFTAIEMGARCLVMCQGSHPTKTIKKLAEDRGCVIISTPYDTFTTARFINQSIPVSFCMTAENLLSFQVTDSLEDVEEMMKTNRFHNFPVMDKSGKYLGLISRRRLLNIHRKKVILVDHNEAAQAVDGVEKADVLGIIDHHRLGGFATLEPVFFRNQPVGCTATIIYQMYTEQGITPSAKTAGLLASAIISDTLMFRSPTCTPLDRQVCVKLAELAGIEVEDFADRLFEASSGLQSKTPEEICYQDFKTFTNDGYSFGVSQVTAMNQEELDNIRAKVEPCLDTLMKTQGLDMMFLMMTNIVQTSTELLCHGEMAEETARDAFNVPDDQEKIVLKGIVSRKKQFLPTFVEALQEIEE